MLEEQLIAETEDQENLMDVNFNINEQDENNLTIIKFEPHPDPLKIPQEASQPTEPTKTIAPTPDEPSAVAIAPFGFKAKILNNLDELKQEVESLSSESEDAQEIVESAVNDNISQEEYKDRIIVKITELADMISIIKFEDTDTPAFNDPDKDDNTVQDQNGNEYEPVTEINFNQEEPEELKDVKIETIQEAVIDKAIENGELGDEDETESVDQATDEESAPEELSQTQEVEQPVEVEESSEPQQPPAAPSVQPGPKEFHIFDHSLEQIMDEKLKTLDDDAKLELEHFLYKQKQLFPYIDGKISLFGLYILKTLLDLLSKKEDLNYKYKLTTKLDNTREPLCLTELYNPRNVDYKFDQDEETDCIYFRDKAQAEAVLNELLEFSVNGKIKLFIEKDFISTCKEEACLPINPSNLLSFPLFSIENIENLIENSKAFEKLLNYKVPELDDKTAIKLIHHGEWTKTKWMKHFNELILNSEKILTKEEKELFEFQEAEFAYNKYMNDLKSSPNLKLFVITDPSILPEYFSKKDEKLLKEIYTLVYFSWIKYLIKPQNINQIVEEYSLNMYAFSSNTNIYNKNSSFAFRQELFTNTPVLISNGEQIKKLSNELIIDKSDFKLEEQSPFSISLVQLNYLFPNHTIDWLEFNFIIKQINDLIKNDFLYFKNSHIFLNPLLNKYYDVLSADKFSHFSLTVSEAFNSYFSQDINSFINKISKINEKPF